tara:strand:+ start:1356 stop:1736 length:381 start_codon:yes stop_codon:yes gene_type:complete
MKLKKVVLALIAIPAFFESAYAVDNARNIYIRGIGTTLCASFLQHESQRGAAYNNYMEWVDGFLTATSISQAMKSGQPLLDLPMDNRAEVLADYCRDKPQAEFYLAAVSLAFEMGYKVDGPGRLQQ